MASLRRQRYFVAPAALLLGLGGVGGLLALLLRAQTDLIRSMNDYGGLASWVQAVMSVAAIAAGFMVLLLQNALEHRADRRDCCDQVCLMAGVAQTCAEDFQAWVDRLDGASGPLGRFMSLVHLDVAIEGLMFRDVGEVRANRLMIELRRLVAEFWWQIENADEVLRDKLPRAYYPACLAEMRQLTARVRAIGEELDALKD